MLELLVQSLVKLGASHQILGLSKWLTDRPQFSKLVNADLLTAAAFQADSRCLFITSSLFRTLPWVLDPGSGQDPESDRKDCLHLVD